VSMSSEYIIDFIDPRSVAVPEHHEAVDDAAVARLMHSFEEVGMLHPIVTRWVEDGSYEGGHPELIAGRQRLEAALRLRTGSIPAVQYEASDDEAKLLSLTENFARKKPSPAWEARATVESEKLARRIAAQNAADAERRKEAVRVRAAELAEEEAQQAAAESDSAAFVKAEALRLGVDERTIQLRLQWGKGICEKAWAVIDTNKKLQGVRALKEIVAETTEDEQLRVIEGLLTPPPPAPSRADRFYSQWQKLSVDVQREALCLMLDSEVGAALVAERAAASASSAKFVPLSVAA